MSQLFALVLSLNGQLYVIDHDLTWQDCQVSKAANIAASIELDVPNSRQSVPAFSCVSQ